MYEQLFQIRPARAIPPPSNPNQKGQPSNPAPSGMMIDPITGRLVDPNAEGLTTKNLRKMGAAAITRQAISKGQGFRIVDMDDFVVGLNNTVFYWLGNDVRSAAPTVCFTEVSNADTGVASTSFDPSSSLLVSIGFEVPNLDTVVNRLRFETKDELEWDSMRYRMIKFGMMARFTDEWNGYFIDLLCTKTIEANLPRAGGVAATKMGSRMTLREMMLQKDGKEPGTESRNSVAKPRGSVLGMASQSKIATPGKKKKYEWAIDLNHLKGQARVFSAGAVIRKRNKKVEESDSDEEDFKVPNPVSLARRGTVVYGSRASTSQFMSPSQTGLEAIKSTPPEVVKKAVPKTKDDMIRAAFIKKLKSASCMW